MPVIWRRRSPIATIGSEVDNLSLAAPSTPLRSDAMIENTTFHDGFEISPRFRRSIEERIARLEEGAARDESMIISLGNPDHVRRQMRLVATQRLEALRMRIFLDRSRVRPTRTINAPPIA